MAMWLIDRMASQGEGLALAAGDGTTSTYAQLHAATVAWTERLRGAGVGAGAVVSVEGDYATSTVAAFLALMERAAIVVPLARDSQAHAEDFRRIGQVEWRVRPGAEDAVARTGLNADHEHYTTLRERGVPGLVLFSSGSTGDHKAAVHDLAQLLKKFETPRHSYRTLVFLGFDHIGGVNTLLYTLANGGAVITVSERSAAAVAGAIERHRVQLLPTSPTFLNLLLLSGEHERHDLSSLELITYGTEAMPESTLKRVGAVFPSTRLLQTYGLTEVGILRSKSRGDDSLWVRVGGEGFETKVKDGRLWIRAESAMLGYLNAPSPFDEDGFLDTGDRVEVDGEWLRILGRDSEIINVGGNKVYPAEVESALLEMDGVADVVVRGERNPIMGNVVVATFRLTTNEPLAELKSRVRRFCQGRMAPFKVPAKIELATGPLHSERFKRMRRAQES